MGSERGTPPVDVHTRRMIALALREDIGSGDITSRAVYGPRERCSARMVLKQDGVVSGLEVAEAVFRRVSRSVLFEPLARCGAVYKAGTVIARLEGPVRALLAGERTALNILQYLCGIATCTHRVVGRLRGTKTRILDTRKTLPLLRGPAKRAVCDGGGTNHRMGLYDMVLIKDNHISRSGGIARAVQRVRKAYGTAYRIEVETTTLAEVREALELRPDIVMLDNMGLSAIRTAVALRDRCARRVKLEVSGNMTERRVASCAATGVDYISMGALTHSVRACDISFLLG